jgi:hypothetical protein
VNPVYTWSDSYLEYLPCILHQDTLASSKKNSFPRSLGI